MWTGRGIKVGGHQFLGSYGLMVGVLSVGLQKSRTVWHCRRQRWNMWRSLELFRKESGFGIRYSKWKCLVLRHLSSQPTTMELSLSHPTTPLTDAQNTSTYDITAFACTSKAMSLKSHTHLVLSTWPTSSPSCLDMSSFKNTSAIFLWALAEGVCWDLSHDSIKRPCGHSSLLLL